MTETSRTIRVKVNGSQQELAVASTLEALLEALGMSGQRVAVEVNEQVIPRSDYPRTTLRDGDDVEIIRAIGGG
jgi:sulfur carrier protein